MRVFGISVLVIVGLMVLVPCAYLVGPWPQRLSVCVAGPPSWRLVRVDDRECDEQLPATHSHFLGFGTSGTEVVAQFEVSDRAAQARCRLYALNSGGFVTGHTALLRGVESLDGSLWLLREWNLEMKPATPGMSWFGCETNGRKALQFDGVPDERGYTHTSSFGPGVTHTIECDNWTLDVEADACTAIHLAEWGSPSGNVIRCAQAGFASATLAVDGGVAKSVAVDKPIKFDGSSVDLRLESQEGRRARVRLRCEKGLTLTLRVSR